MEYFHIETQIYFFISFNYRFRPNICAICVYDMCYLYLSIYTGKEDKMMKTENYCDWLSGSFYFNFCFFLFCVTQLTSTF